MQENNFNLRLYCLLDKYFTDDFGVSCVCFDKDGNVDTISIDRLSNVTVNSATWTYHASITRWDDGTWEVSEQFKGEGEDELWIYGYYKRFADACKCIATGKFKRMKPIEIYY